MAIGDAMRRMNPDCFACASCAACKGECEVCPYWDYSKHDHKDEQAGEQS